MTSRLCVTLVAALAAAPAMACPFCAAEQKTLYEEINDSSVTLLARLSKPSAAAEALANSDVPYSFVDPETGTARFAVERVLRGEELVRGVEEIEAIYFGEPDTERLYLIRGVGEPPDWAIPLPLSEVAAAYVPEMLALPKSGGDRLAFMQQYLEHEDPLLAQDAYDEFARAPYADVIELGPRMDRGQLLDWIEDPRVSPSRRRLFLTMLGVCGQAEDLAQLERMLLSDARVLGPAADAAAAISLATSGAGLSGLGVAMLPESIRMAERQRKLGLDALIACYLTLAGKHGDATEGLDLIDERFLKDPGADYSHVYAALQALRFLVEEQRELVPPERVIASARLLLNNADFADQVIPDLARWEDWEVLGRLAEMYKATFDEPAPGEKAPLKYVREPIITYLDVAAEQKGAVGEQAVAALAELEPLDPDAVKRARSLRAFGFLAQARAKQADKAAPTPDPSVVMTAASGDGESAEPETPATPEPPPPSERSTAEAAPPTAEPVTNPPSRLLLIAAPVGATVLLTGLFWLILRGGGV